MRTRRTKESNTSEEGFVPSCYLEQAVSSNKSQSIEESAIQEPDPEIDPKIKETRKKREYVQSLMDFYLKL